MRGSGGCGGALGAPLCSRATLQEGSPGGGAWFSDLMAVCQQLSTNSGPGWNYGVEDRLPGVQGLTAQKRGR